LSSVAKLYSGLLFVYLFYFISTTFSAIPAPKTGCRKWESNKSIYGASFWDICYGVIGLTVSKDRLMDLLCSLAVGGSVVCWRGDSPHVLLQFTRGTAERPERSEAYHRDVFIAVISLCIECVRVSSIYIYMYVPASPLDKVIV